MNNIFNELNIICDSRYANKSTNQLAADLKESSRLGAFDPDLLKAVERVMLLDGQRKEAAQKGAVANRLLAQERRREILHLASDLIAGRSREYYSYLQLATDIKASGNIESSIQLIRKVLSEANLLK